jgi:drug/metabolite transporter (DMT)-like permease
MSKKIVKEEKTISNQVLDQIKEGQVQMHPDWYFALLSTGFAAALAFTLVVAIYAINLAVLRLEIVRSGMQPFLLGRYYFDLGHLPIGFLLIAALSIAGVICLLRHRSHYTRSLPEWSIVLGVIVFVICLGSGLSRTSINRNLQRQGPFRPFYEQSEPRPAMPMRERNMPPAM